MIKVLHTISGIWQQTGGPAESVPRLCSALTKIDNQVSIFTLAGCLSNAALESASEGVEILSQPHYKQISWQVFPASRKLVQQYDIVHDHGLWLPLNWASGLAAIKYNKPLIITTRGSLNPNALKHSPYKKKIAGWMFDNRYLRAAHCIHATSYDEYIAIRDYGLKNPVAIIPNGIQPDVFQDIMSVQAFKQKYAIPQEAKILLFLSRISWEKGLEDLAEAWSSIAPDFPNWHLVIVGSGTPDYVSKLKQLYAAQPAGNRVSWLGALAGRDKFAAYAAAKLFVLPSHTENFSLVTVEALAAGVPVVTTQGTPWAELPERGCGWWVPVGAAGITTGLGEAMAIPDKKLAAMGVQGKAMIGEKYTWPVIARQMLDVYEWMLGYREMPSFVKSD